MKTAILSDIHGNSPALRAVLADVRQTGCERLVVLGDVIAGYDPRGCLELLAGWKDLTCIRGNAEAYLLTPDRAGIPDRELRLYLEVDAIMNWFEAELTTEQLEWLRSWPDLARLDGALLVHDHPLDRLYPQRWQKPGLAEHYQELYFHSPGLGLRTPQDRFDEVDRWMAESETGLVFLGHTHEPYLRQMEHGILCNVGSAGTPLDGLPRPSWALVEGDIRAGCRIELRRMEYDVSEYTRMIEARRDFPDWQIPGRAPAYRRMVETGEHWKAFVPHN